jgi:hypothetical protein
MVFPIFLGPCCCCCPTVVNILSVTGVSISSGIPAIRVLWFSSPLIFQLSPVLLSPLLLLQYFSEVNVPGVPAVAWALPLKVLLQYNLSTVCLLPLMLLTCILLLVFPPVLASPLLLALPAVPVVSFAAVYVFLPLLFLSGFPGSFLASLPLLASLPVIGFSAVVGFLDVFADAHAC